MHIKNIFFIIIVIIFVNCVSSHKEKITEEKTIISKNYAYILIYKNKIILFNNDFSDTLNLEITDTIVDVSISDNIYMKSKDNLYEFDIGKFSFINRGKFNASFDNTVFLKDARIIMFDSSLVIKHQYKQYNLLEKTLPLKQFRVNPFHPFVYVLDSLGYLYSVDYKNHMLKKKIFTGKINKLNFYKYGTRLHILTDNSFIILDYETLNIIYEKNGQFSYFAFSQSLGNLYLLNNNKNKLYLIDAYEYKDIESIEFSNPINSLFVNDSILIACENSLSSFYIFKNNKSFKKIKPKEQCDSVLFFNNNFIFYKNNNNIIAQNIYNDSILFSMPTKDIMLTYAFEIIDSFPDKINLKKYEITSIVKKEKEIISNTFYSIQLASFKNIEQARKTLKEHKKLIKNKRIFIIKANINDNIYYRVMAGQFSSKEEAAILKDYLLKIGYSKDIFITPVYKKDIIK